MCHRKTLTGKCLWARKVASRVTEVAIRVGVLDRTTTLAWSCSVRTE